MTSWTLARQRLDKDSIRIEEDHVYGCLIYLLETEVSENSPYGGDTSCH